MAHSLAIAGAFCPGGISVATAYLVVLGLVAARNGMDFVKSYDAELRLLVASSEEYTEEKVAAMWQGGGKVAANTEALQVIPPYVRRATLDYSSSSLADATADAKRDFQSDAGDYLARAQAAEAAARAARGAPPAPPPQRHGLDGGRDDLEEGADPTRTSQIISFV